MMCTQSAIHAQPLSESTDEASCICEYQLWQLLVFAHTLVLVLSHLQPPTQHGYDQHKHQARSGMNVRITLRTCCIWTGVGDAAQIGVKLMVMAQMRIS